MAQVNINALPKSIMRKHRDSLVLPDIKISNNIDDILAAVTHFDESGDIERLPTLVAADPDQGRNFMLRGQVQEEVGGPYNRMHRRVS